MRRNIGICMGIIGLAASLALMPWLGWLNDENGGLYGVQAAQEEEALLAGPVPTVHFTQQHPASLQPIVTWTKVPGAVSFELQMFRPAGSGERLGEPFVQIFTTRYIYIHGYALPIPDTYTGNIVYWRVRGLNLEGQPISEFSALEPVYIDRTLAAVVKPIPTSVFNEGNGTVLLYPVYMWIPIQGADRYEVEILDDEPENPNDTAPSSHRIDSAEDKGFDHYDDYPRISEKPFYWRVRGLDAEGNAVGVYSDARSFRVNPDENYTVATFGDSITHGGGSISYSPTDWEYSYQYYLNFPSINLGLSGDTSATTAERFDKDVVPFHPKYLIILMGTNSLRAGISADDVIADMKTVRQKCRDNGIRPVFLTLPPINPANIKRAFDEPTDPDWQKSFAAVNDFVRTQVYIDVAAGMADENGLLKTKLALDGIHPDVAGKKMMAAAINARWPVILSLPEESWD
jgi:lysophospholipase L1-like esterase